jgi:anti-sigma factor RsiW
MNCSQFDLKGYVLGELTAAERSGVEGHLKACRTCGEEMERLRLTSTALASLGDEELPRRIAFVPDGVFEPKSWARWWNSGPRLGFASAAMLSLAILVHGFTTYLQGQRTAELMAEAERRMEIHRQSDLVAMQETVSMLQKRMNVDYLYAARYGGGQ